MGRRTTARLLEPAPAQSKADPPEETTERDLAPSPEELEILRHEARRIHQEAEHELQRTQTTGIAEREPRTVQPIDATGFITVNINNGASLLSLAYQNAANIFSNLNMQGHRMQLYNYTHYLVSGYNDIYLRIPAPELLMIGILFYEDLNINDRDEIEILNLRTHQVLRSYDSALFREYYNNRVFMMPEPLIVSNRNGGDIELRLRIVVQMRLVIRPLIFIREVD